MKAPGARTLTSCFAGDFEAALHGGERGDEVDVSHGLRGAQKTVHPEKGLRVGEILDPSWPAEPPAARSTLRHTYKCAPCRERKGDQNFSKLRRSARSIRWKTRARTKPFKLTKNEAHA